MAEVQISYKGSAIAQMNASGTKTLLTEGKYLEDNVEVTYTRPAAPSGTKNISITANGQTTEDVTAYASAQITANVPNTYAAGDEGKVVDNGALVSQTSDSVTQNGTYDTTLISSLTVNVSGSVPAVKSSFCVEDFVMPSGKFVCGNNMFPNLIASGGYLHLIYTLQENTNTSNDLALLCFGTSNLAAWTPTATVIGAYFNVSKASTVLKLHLRATGSNTSLGVSDYADENGRVNIKFYSDKYVDVNTGTEYTYTTAQQAFFTVLSGFSYISVGCNQSNPFTGAVIEKWAIQKDL